MRRARAPRAREPWGKRPNGPRRDTFGCSSPPWLSWRSLAGSRRRAMSPRPRRTHGADVHDRATRGARVRRLDAQPPRVRARSHPRPPPPRRVPRRVGRRRERARGTRRRGVGVAARPMSREGWSTPRVVARAPARRRHTAPLPYSTSATSSTSASSPMAHPTSPPPRTTATRGPPRNRLRRPTDASRVRGERRRDPSRGGARVVLCGVVGDDGDARVDVSLDDGVTFARGAALVPSRTSGRDVRSRRASVVAHGEDDPRGRPRRLRARRRVRR